MSLSLTLTCVEQRWTWLVRILSFLHSYSSLAIIQHTAQIVFQWRMLGNIWTGDVYEFTWNNKPDDIFKREPANKNCFRNLKEIFLFWKHFCQYGLHKWVGKNCKLSHTIPKCQDGRLVLTKNVKNVWRVLEPFAQREYKEINLSQVFMLKFSGKRLFSYLRKSCENRSIWPSRKSKSKHIKISQNVHV